MITEKEIMILCRLQDLYRIDYITLKKLNSASKNFIKLHLAVLTDLIAREIATRVAKADNKIKKLLNKSNEYFYRKCLWKNLYIN